MEVRQVRTDEIKLIKIDEPAANIRYIGRSDSMRASESDPVWQICRQYRNGDIIISTYALMGEFKCSWTDRTTYFDAAIPDNTNPIDGNIAVTGTFSLTGLSIAGRFTPVELTNTEWRPLPVTPLANRNNMTVINEGNVIVRLNFNTLAPFEGRPVFPNGGKETFDIRGTIPIYGRTESGTFYVGVEELA